MEAANDYIVILVLFGFPIALVLAWALEVTPHGIKRTPDLKPDQLASQTPESWRASSWLLAGVVIAAALGAGYFGLLRESGADLPLETSLALAREDFFSGDYEDGKWRIAALTSKPDIPRQLRLKALRYQARASIAVSDDSTARQAVEAMVDLEPPLVLLHPAVETAELVSLYGSVRRDPIRSSTTAPSKPLEEVRYPGFLGKPI